MGDAFVDISDFQFRALQRIRVFDKPDGALYDGTCPSWIAVSSQYGIVVCASGCDKLISLRSSDVCRIKSKVDINVEVTDIPMKVTNLEVKQPIALTSLACNCSGRLLSVSMRTASGAFIYLYDMCAFAVDYIEQRGPVYGLRLSADSNAQPCVLEWNPQQSDMFAVATSDGVLSCYSFNIEKSSSVTLVGTVKHEHIVTCIGWSPKGKQLVVGDVSGCIKQYKPEMALVRIVPPPSKDENHALRCVGISWLATTDILIAYSPKTGQEVDITKLCIRKDAPPQWTHFDDINFCGDKSIFDQRIHFTQLLSWKLVLCSSSRSSDVAVLGKIDSEWKVWTLDDSGRIEVPLDSEHHESFPIGVSIDLSSSIFPAEIGTEGDAEHPSCPTVLVLSSQGVLLAFNALSSRAEHQNIKIHREGLPSEIYGTIVAKVDETHNEHSYVSSPNATCPTVPTPENLRASFVSLEGGTIPKHNVFQLQTDAKLDTSQTVQATTMLKLHGLSPCGEVGEVQDSKAQQQQVQEHLEHQQVKSETHLIELQEDFRKKLIIFDKHFFELCERNDWLQNLKKSSAKQLEWNNGINLDDEISELEKVRTVVASWLDGLENQLKESMCSVEEQLGIANSTDRELFDSRRMLDFNNMHRLDKFVEALAKLEQKIANIEDVLTEMPTSNTKNRSVLTLDIGQEQQITTTAKNICKGMISRRKALYELQRQITSLSGRLRSLKKDQRMGKFFTSTRSPLSNSSFNYQTQCKELTAKAAYVTAQQKRELLKFLTERGSVKRSEAKIFLLDNHPTDEGVSSSTITDIENRLLKAALMPITAPAKVVMDIGTQSSDYLLPKETKLSADVVTSNPIAPASFMPATTNKFPAVQSNQKQKLADSAVKSSATIPVSTNLNSCTTAVPTTSSLFAADAITKQIPAVESSMNVSKTAVVNQEKHDNIAFSFKNLDVPSAAKNDIASQGIANIASSKPDGTFGATQKISLTKSNETSLGSVESTTLKSLTKISEPVVTSSTTATTIDKTSTQSTEIASTSNEIAATDSTVSMVTPKSSSSKTDVSFSFKLPAEGNQQASPSVLVGASTTSAATANSHSKDLEVMGDDGMMEAEGTSIAPTALFSSSLSFGLENAVSNSNSTQNVFSSGLKFLQSAQPQTSSLFGSTAAGNKSTSVFGSGVSTTASGSGGFFSRTQQSNVPSSAFSFNSAANSFGSSSLFASKPTTGSTFGGAPSFGSKPAFGSPSPLASAFSQQRSQNAASATTAFSNFAKTSTVGFGSLAASQQQQSSVSVFGGSGFGALAQQPQKSSIFGGGLNSSVTNSSSFSTWR